MVRASILMKLALKVDEIDDRTLWWAPIHPAYSSIVCVTSIIVIHVDLITLSMAIDPYGHCGFSGLVALHP